MLTVPARWEGESITSTVVILGNGRDIVKIMVGRASFADLHQEHVQWGCEKYTIAPTQHVDYMGGLQQLQPHQEPEVEAHREKGDKQSQ